jgi:prepilin-type N-terminal cleavage/methylation domain-containing protein
MKNKKGFTLIELLVVIAVIAILASIVFVNLGGARESAQDTRIISAMGQIRSVAEMLYLENDYNYDDVCVLTSPALTGTLSTSGDLGTLGTEITAAGGTSIACHADATTDGNAQAYCVEVLLNDDTSTWCVSSDGTSSRGMECNDTTAVCEVPA